MNQIFEKEFYQISINLLKLLRKSLVFSSKIFILGGISLNVYPESIFTEDFDSLPNQPIIGQCVYEGHPGKPEGACDTVPTNWDFIYTSSKNKTNPPAEIMNGIDKVGGKALRVYDESYGDNNSWGHDVQLAKHFSPNQYPELWVSLWIKFNPDLNTNGLSAAKIFRMGHYNPKVIDGTTATSIVNTNNKTNEGPTTSGLVFYDIKRVNNTHYRHKIAMRGGPSYKIAFTYNFEEFEIRDKNGEVSDKSWSATFGDGQWHRYEVGMIMNSSPGVKDGKVLVYLDGIYQGGKNNVPWLQSGHDPDVTGFNMFTIAGNADFLWDGQSNAEQHFYDIDNVEACTARCSAPKPPSSVQAQ